MYEVNVIVCSFEMDEAIAFDLVSFLLQTISLRDANIKYVDGILE